MAITFWDLNVPERSGLVKLYRDEPLCNMPLVGKKSINRLIELGLIEESPNTPFGAPIHYRRTPEGERVYEDMWRNNQIPQ
jgi:hypothetical protein